MKKIFLIILAFVAIQTLAFSQLISLQEQSRYYADRYKVLCTDDKITDNFGNGFPELYGTRNMRPILHGVAYRGGANNFYHASAKRGNHNPLPEDGLVNLCMEGFTTAVYLYGTNFKTARNFVEIPGKHLDYLQLSGNSRKEIREIMSMVYDVITRKTKGPIYFHCWNGWHQSGYVSSSILKQFCSYSDDEAFSYWMRNTDGVNKGYANVKSLVKGFEPFKEFVVSKEIQEEICPCQKR